jgi:hypothetical protein
LKQNENKVRLCIFLVFAKAREIIDQLPQSGFIPIIENWRERPDGQIEFAIRHLPA